MLIFAGLYKLFPKERNWSLTGVQKEAFDAKHESPNQNAYRKDATISWTRSSQVFGAYGNFPLSFCFDANFAFRLCKTMHEIVDWVIYTYRACPPYIHITSTICKPVLDTSLLCQLGLLGNLKSIWLFQYPAVSVNYIGHFSLNNSTQLKAMRLMHQMRILYLFNYIHEGTYARYTLELSTW